MYLPDERAEGERVVHRSRLRAYEVPSPTDSRGWRLGEAVGLDAWLGLHPARWSG